MKRSKFGLTMLFITLALTFTGCGDSDMPVLTYVPVTTGSTWTYSRADNGTQTQTVTANANGQVTREVIDTTTGKSVATINISNKALYLAKLDSYAADGTVSSTRTYSPAPGQLFFSSSTMGGTHETQTVQITTLPANTTTSTSLDLTVLGFEMITVPAGTFNNALKVQTTLSSGTTFTSWFALNVGMIRQDVNGTKSVELSSYSIK